MKRFCLLIGFILILSLIFTMTILADNEMNIAPEASASVNYPRWSIDPSKINDGDRTKGCASNQSYKDMEYYLDFGEDRIFTEIIVVVNGIGTYPTDGAFTWNTMSNNEFWFEVRVDDSNGNRVYTKGANLSTRDQNENGEVFFPLDNVKGSKITIYIVQNWNNCCGLWEVEAYEHICNFDTVKERAEQETCTKDGYGTYECECGRTMDGVIPARGYHTYEGDAEVIYENGYLQNGEERHYCLTCEEFQGNLIKPIFKFLGYSTSSDKSAVCVGYAVDMDVLTVYESIMGKISYGAVVSTQQSTELLSESGEVSTPSTVKAEASTFLTNRFDIKIKTNDWSKIADNPFIMCAYVIDNGKVSYLVSENQSTRQAQFITYNQIINA